MNVILARGIALACSLAAGAAVAQERMPEADDLGAVVVIGSRIPRSVEEGPAPVTTIDAETIRLNGYQSVPDLLRAVTQNGGETQSQQSFSGGSFTPGAQQVDLRGLGPNHTLVLVNGRRIADFPLPFQGRSNFTDISNIPVSLIDQVEVLSGSASAVYGSDAIAGVINFKLKKETDGTTLDYRAGGTWGGGASSHRFTLTSGWSGERFHVVGGIEYLLQQPLWATDRSIQDSTEDDPTRDPSLARRAFLRINQDDVVYMDPGAATCQSLSYLNGGTTIYASRPGWGDYDPVIDDFGPGFFCGSNKSIGYGTIISGRQGFNSYASMGYALNDDTELFVDLQFGLSRVALMNDVLSWNFQDANGSSDTTFFNTTSGLLEDWQRQFAPEESGGFDGVKTRNRQQTYSFTPGIKGKLGDEWSYELAFNRSQYKSTVKWAEVIASAANTLFLGPQLGIDPNSGYPAFAADPARLYTPLTKAEYDSIATYTVYNPKSWTNSVSATVNTGDLFSLPAGPVGFAAVAEFGKQGYDINPDPLALTNYYYGLKDSDGQGTRTHRAVGGELRAPLTRMLEASVAARYDQYSFAGNDAGRFTYNAGLEFRPIATLLLRAAYGTGFRAPDLHYVFTGPGNVSPSADDYFLCRTLEPNEDIGDCTYSGVGITAARNGNRALKPETSKSFTAGFVWAPVRDFDISVDWFDVKLSNQVLDLSIDSLLRDEADCRIGQTAAGTPVDVNSPTCVDAIARVRRFQGGALDGEIDTVFINPINVARESTKGYDIAMRGAIETRAGRIAASVGHTQVNSHDFTQYPGDPTIDKLAFDSGYYLPRQKTTASVTYSKDAFTWTVEGSRLGKLPNWAEDAYIEASWLFNTTVQYDFNENVRASLSIDNVLDREPVRDPTYASYPYYDISWFDSVGRAAYLQVTYKIGAARR